MTPMTSNTLCVDDTGELRQSDVDDSKELWSRGVDGTPLSRTYLCAMHHEAVATAKWNGRTSMEPLQEENLMVQNLVILPLWECRRSYLWPVLESPLWQIIGHNFCRGGRWVDTIKLVLQGLFLDQSNWSLGSSSSAINESGSNPATTLWQLLNNSAQEHCQKKVMVNTTRFTSSGRCVRNFWNFLKALP